MYLLFGKRVDLILCSHPIHKIIIIIGWGETLGGDKYVYSLDGGDGFTGIYLPLIKWLKI